MLQIMDFSAVVMPVRPCMRFHQVPRSQPQAFFISSLFLLPSVMVRLAHQVRRRSASVAWLLLLF